METFFQKTMRLVAEEKERRGTWRALCGPLGLNPTTAQKWYTEKKGGEPRAPGVDQVGVILDSMGVQLVAPGEQLASYEFISCGLPYLDDAGLLQIRERPHAPIALERHWLRNADIHPASSVMVEVADEAMEPLFGKGDFVLVDRADVYPQAGRVYLLTTQKNDLRILRLKSEAGLAWSLLAENPACHWYNEQVPDISQITIHGRVRWSSRMF